MSHQALEKNIQKVFALKFFGMFLVLMPVIVPFFQSVGIGMKGVYLIQSVFGITVFLLEIPSGYISDILGRKKTLIVSFALKGIGFSLFPFAKDLNDFLIAEVILGFGLSLSSGTDTALLYDTMEFTSPGKAHIKVLGKSISYGALGEGLASLIGSGLLILSFSPNHLAQISGAMSWINFFIALTLVEPGRIKMQGRHRDNFVYIFSKLFKQTKLLKLIIFNSIFSFSGTLLAVWMFQKYWELIHIPIIYFGFLWAAMNFMVSYVSKGAHKLEKKWGSSFTILFVGLLPIAGYLGISLVDHFLGVLVCLIFQVSRAIGQVIFRDALNRRVTGDFRATANSVIQMGVRIFFAIIGPVFGYFIDTKGISYASVGATIFYLIIFLFLILPLLRERKNFSPIG